ncbi:MAG: AMP-binding protein, partial [Acidobacteria bacterium]|nr:AMP-binding protein [Acidobacteriota bacterium]
MFGDLEHFGDLLRRNARWRGSETGIVYGETRLTWRQLNARANRFARAIRLRGVRQHDRVAVLSRNCHEYVEVLFGLAKIGVVAVPINYRLADPEVEFICRDSGAVALIADADHLSTAAGVASRVPTVRQLIAFGDHGAEAETSYDALVRASDEGEPVAERPIAPDDLLLFLYTSGTTGFPKGVMYTHRGTLVGMLVHVLAIGSHADHRVMLPAPLYSAAGMAGIFCGVYVGSHIVLINFDPQLALETIERERITFTNFVPTTIQMLTTLENVERYDLSSMKVLLYGGAPMPEPVLRRAAG